MAKTVFNGLIITAATDDEKELVKIVETLTRPVIGLALDGIQIQMQFGQTEVDSEGP